MERKRKGEQERQQRRRDRAETGCRGGGEADRQLSIWVGHLRIIKVNWAKFELCIGETSGQKFGVL